MADYLVAFIYRSQGLQYSDGRNLISDVILDYVKHIRVSLNINITSNNDLSCQDKYQHTLMLFLLSLKYFRAMRYK